MSEIPCISFDAFFRNIWEKVTSALHNIFLFLFSYAVLIYFYIELAGFCDAIDIKVVKWVFPYLHRKRQSDAQHYKKIRFKNKFHNIHFRA